MAALPNHPPLGLQRAVRLDAFTTWKVGGEAQWFGEPATGAELWALVRWAQLQKLPLHCIGAGSNLLIADGGLGGLTLCHRRLQGSQLDGSSGLVEAEAGEPIPTLARKAARAGLSGLEWAVGIPGTVGGAVVMNAGAQGGCTAEWLHSVTLLNPLQPEKPIELLAAELAFGYRQSLLQQEPWIVLSARFQLESGHDPAAITARTSANLHSRTSSQPYQQPSCGSVFRNPEPHKAGQLIEALGLKGRQVGGAQISPMHANFIVNSGGATAADIEALIAEVQDQVQLAHGMRLHTEVRRLGD
ncbi:UDP-N-acetylmuramate dehydrogenase [Cyanobium sp. HWJ4-Hawea]|uniref:UDP-N-acetylmuramate dehydrogenase n=1 Tax=Cyanobium sp. HWJ4-Hawea TaxID=2823713 RepID=UPI0020CCC7F3|nr:UDP-N-acetylmuramate dehydrogenase [Cyanobium sp. HWJ4-Hawea]MCP9808097.1 UDP-N-acetylmuramate dehydrogenase [Cyanobium sp. HWJ4-Hawea]